MTLPSKSIFYVLIPLILALGFLELATYDTKILKEVSQKNLETLKSAKPNDLVLCISENNGAKKVQRAIIVEQNDGAYLRGHQIDSMSLERIAHGGYPYTKFYNCKIEVQRDMPTSNMPAHIGRIFLYGLNNPQHPIR